MKKLLRSGWAVIPVLLLLGGPPCGAQNIPSGDDVWNTPGGGGTYFTMPGSDLDALCGVTGHPNTTILLVGKNLPGQGNGDIVIRRLNNAVFPPGDHVSAVVSIQAKDLSFKSASPVSTQCGNLNIAVSLDGGQVNQPITRMTINRDDGQGGSFGAAIKLNVRMDATDSAGHPVGPPLFYSPVLPDPGGTPWAYHPPQNPFNPLSPWFPGVTTSGQPVTVTRFYDPAMGIPASHQYQPPNPPPPPCRHIEKVDPVEHENATEAQAVIVPCEEAAPANAVDQ